MSTRFLGVMMIVGSTLAALNSFRTVDNFDLVSSIALLL
jgi:hypothetical protein